MKNMNRRDLCAALSAFAAINSLPLSAQTSQRTVPEPLLAHSKGYSLDALPVTHQPGGAEMRAIIHGVLPTGEAVDIHETTLPPGQIPHPPHKHLHSEFTLIREGTLEFYNDGKPEIVGAGGVIFAASGVMHGWKNVGEIPAKYFVVAVGSDQKKI